MKSIIFSIGNEVTSGHTVNTNASWIATRLEPYGLTPERILTLRDDVSTLTSEIRAAVKKYNLVVITGGLGPTHDDVTKPALVKAFKTQLRRDAKTLREVKRFFKNINRPMPPVNEGQADVPEGCEVIRNKFGTAPCLLFDTGDCMLFALPGVPYEMQNLVDTEVAPRVAKRFSKSAIARTVLRTIGIGESTLCQRVDEAGVIGKEIELAYLPHFGQVDMRLTAYGKNTKDAKSKLDRTVTKLLPIAGPWMFGRDEETLEQIIGELLYAKNLKLACAESCTGGLFASRITSVSGSSHYFLEGVVTYSNKAKVKRLKVNVKTLAKHGAVSAETAAEMAKGIVESSGADIGLSSTGVAGPTGGTKDKPVGLIYIGLCVRGEVETKELRLGMDRNRNQDRTAKEMMAWLWQTVREM